MNISILMVIVLLFGIVSAVKNSRRALKEILMSMIDENSGKSDPEYITRAEFNNSSVVYVVCDRNGKPVLNNLGNYRTYTEKYDADKVTKKLNEVGVVVK